MHKPVVATLKDSIMLAAKTYLVQLEYVPVTVLHTGATSMGCVQVGVTVALPVGVSSVMVTVSGLASGRRTRAPHWPLLPSTDTRVVSVALRVSVLRSTHN